MSTIQQELVIKARADVSDAKKGLASLDQSVDGLASAQEGLKSASADAAQGLAAEASAATAAASAVQSTARASEEAAKAASKLETEAKGAGSGMDKAAGEARKLTDQIREVGDGMDVAAGKMIEGIGGPTAIKAIAGAGMALGALQQVAGAFLDSSEALFKSWGEEGVKVWDVTERGLFKLKGQLAASVLGADDMYQSAGRLDTALTAVNTAAEMGAEYMKMMWNASLVKVLFDVTGATEAYADMAASATEKIRRQVEAEKNAATSAAALVKPLGSAREQYESIAETVARLTGKVVDKDKVERESTIARLEDLQRLAIAEEKNAQLKAIRDNAELKRAEFTANATRELMARGQREAADYINKMDDIDRGALTNKQRERITQETIARLIETERPAMIQKQIESYRREATALMAEMASPLETGTQLFIESLQTQINEIESEGKKTAATAGGNIGKSFVGGIKNNTNENSFDPIIKEFTEWWGPRFQNAMINEKAGIAFQEWIKSLFPKEEDLSESFSQLAETGSKLASDLKSAFTRKPDDGSRLPSYTASEKAAKDAVTSAQAAAQEQIKNIQETSGAVLDLADAFATLGGVQDGVVDKMRQVVDVVIKIMQATEALSAVPTAQAATATASAAATSVAASSAAAATATAGAAGASAFVPVLGAVTAAIGLIGSLFGGESSSGPQRRTKPRTVYTSAGESQGAGGDFAYFEGGRSNVTIVTNDAASIRAMQGRLSFVAARGGSGF